MAGPKWNESQDIGGNKTKQKRSQENIFFTFFFGLLMVPMPREHLPFAFLDGEGDIASV